MTPEEEARQLIDEKLTAAGWLILDRKNFDRFAGLGGRLPGISLGE